MLKQEFHLKLSQKLTPQQIRLVKMLELSTQEFTEYVTQELEENPALDNKNEFAEKDNETDIINVSDYVDDEQIPTYKLHNNYYSNEQAKEIPYISGQSFLQYLLDQLHTFSLDEEDLKIAEFLVGNIDKHGYIRREIVNIVDDLALGQNIFTTEEKIEQIICNTIQKLEPLGVGARNLQECLLIQINYQQKNEITYICRDILKHSFDLLVKKHYQKILNKHHIDEEILKKALEKIRKLNPKPGMSFDSNDKITEQITPDFSIRIINNVLELELNKKNIPQLYVSKSYDNLLRGYQENKKPTKAQKDSVLFVKQKLDTAKWFIEAVKKRQETLLKTMETIMNFQEEYLLSGDEKKLKPLILQDVANVVQMDVSTISRVANSKYVATPYGTKLIKFFFSESIKNNEGEDISTREIKSTLQDIVNNEDKNKPLTDDELVAKMSKKGYKIARRTIAKYRNQLKIPVARLRKNF